MCASHTRDVTAMTPVTPLARYTQDKHSLIRPKGRTEDIPMKRMSTFLRTFGLASVLGLAALAVPLSAHAGELQVSIGFGLPLPVVVAPPPVYVAPPPVVVAPPPVYVEPAPVVVTQPQVV